MTNFKEIKSSQASAHMKMKKRIPLPQFCDFSCTHANFCQPDAIGACRKDLAVYCTLYKSYNNKNSSCMGRKQ
jgi:hypothetical protein